MLRIMILTLAIVCERVSVVADLTFFTIKPVRIVQTAIALAS